MMEASVLKEIHSLSLGFLRETNTLLVYLFVLIEIYLFSLLGPRTGQGSSLLLHKPKLKHKNLLSYTQKEHLQQLLRTHFFGRRFL